MIFFFLKKQTNSKWIFKHRHCYSSSRNHYVLCCKRLNGFWAICFKCRKTFCLLSLYFMIILKPPPPLLWMESMFCMPACAVAAFLLSSTQICYFLNLGTIVVKWLSHCSISQLWLLAQWHEWSQILNGLVSIDPYLCSTNVCHMKKSQTLKCPKEGFGEWDCQGL